MSPGADREDAQTGTRLAKCVMALANCSRREAEALIEAGVVLVDERVVREPASTQLLLPTPSTPEGGAASKPCVRAATRSGPRPSERYSAA